MAKPPLQSEAPSAYSVADPSPARLLSQRDAAWKAAMLADGAVVTVHYHGTLDDGSVFDTSRGKQPRTFVIGHSQLIPGFESALRQMAVGQRQSVRIEAQDAYGSHQSDRVHVVPIDESPPGLNLGDTVRIVGGAAARVIAVSAQSVHVDANHPLAGHVLTFEIELLSVR